MSASCQATLATALGRPVLSENLTVPTTVNVTRPSPDLAVRNQIMMSQSTALGRRVRLRIQPELFMKDSVKPWSFRRLPQCYTRLSFPNPEQAQLFLDAFASFISSFEGKLLQSSPLVVTTQAIESKVAP